MNITEFLNTNVQKHPLKIAAGYKENDTWKEINWQSFRKLVFRTANALRDAGVKEYDTVGIYAENSLQWITFDLAIMALGGITVPIYATNHTDQVAYIIKEAEIKIILVANQEQYDICYDLKSKNADLQKIIVDDPAVAIHKDDNAEFLADFIANASENLAIVAKKDEDLATIIYTSGTTGVPKGVMLTYRNFIKAFQAHIDFFKFKNLEEEHSLAFLPLTHVFERTWTLFCLSNAVKVSFLSNPKMISHALAEVKPTMMCSVPRFYQKIYAGVNEIVAESPAVKKAIFKWSLGISTRYAERKRKGEKIPAVLNLKHKLADSLVFRKIRDKMGGNLWFMPCGGASISPEVTRFFDALGIHITVGYGLTETTATLTCMPLRNYEHGTNGICIGNTQIKIGENDEILAKGDGVMSGYYKQPEETAKVFTKDGWLKTGDAGRFDEKGNLLITDRIKDLMKTSNGKYIAPQPIENLISNSNSIQQVMLIAEGRPFVTALIVPNFEYLEGQLAKLNVKFTSWKEVLSTEAVIRFYNNKLAEIQQSLAGFEKVKKFILMPAEFQISTGEITSTLKIKRNVVLAKYTDSIEKMYLK